MIKTVIRMSNNIVMVFDNKGEQMPEYQGQYDDVREKILANVPAEVVLPYKKRQSMGMLALNSTPAGARPTSP